MTTEGRSNGGEVVKYTTKELLAEIRDKLHENKNTALILDKRVTSLEGWREESIKLRQELLPRFYQMEREMDVEGQMRKVMADQRYKTFGIRSKLALIAFGAIASTGTIISSLAILGVSL